VAGILLALFLTAQVADLSIFVLNLATMLGLGLAVDYSLFVTSRFREELDRHPGETAAAVERTVATAGRAIFFSGLTVLIGLLGLTLFPFMFLRSVGVAGVIVVFFSVAAGLTLLPALLAIVGPRIDRLSVRRGRPAWSGVGRRRLLGDAGAARDGPPVGDLDPDPGVPPPAGDAVPAGEHLLAGRDDPAPGPAFAAGVRHFGRGVRSGRDLALRPRRQSPTSIYAPDNVAALADLSRRLAADPRIGRVQGIVPSDPSLSREQAIALVGVQRGLARAGVATGAERLATEQTTAVFAYTRYLPNDERNKELLRELRATPLAGDLSLMVDGGTAEIVDVVALMYDSFPTVIALIVGATYLVLFLLFRSVLLPLKAILMNALSILASYGALVWVFQEGHLSRFLGFTPLGFVEASLPVIMFCVLFGSAWTTRSSC
jgi:RND superfamily putative drug exporter